MCQLQRHGKVWQSVRHRMLVRGNKLNDLTSGLLDKTSASQDGTNPGR